MHEVYLIGLSHRTAPVEVRDNAAFSPNEIEDALNDLKQLPGVDESAIISTCNRTEIYVAGNPRKISRMQMESFILDHKPGFTEKYVKHLFFYKGKEAVKHLFRVASGMDSMILGEPQIFGQVKDAYERAHELRATGPILNKLFNFSFCIGKRVRTDTSLGRGAVSVAFAAVELAQKIFRDLSHQKVLLLGAGETGRLAALHFRKKNVQQIFIANRTFSKAEELAEELEGEAVPFDAFKPVLTDVDVVVGATASPEYVVTAEDVKNYGGKRRNKPLFFIDIAVPRDFDPQLNKFENVFLHDIDALQNIVNQNIEARKKELPLAEQMVAEETDSYMQWKRTLQVKPTIIALREKIEAIKNTELEKYKHKVDAETYEQLQLVTRSLVNKILHYPTTELRERINGDPNNIEAIEVIKKMFKLENMDDKNH